MTGEPYVPPRVWTWDAGETGGAFASINRPIAGATHEKDLPIGEHPLQLYSLATPNGQKVTIMLEELLELGMNAEYDAWPIRINEGDQFSSGFVSVNPTDRKSVVEGKSVSVRVDLGGRRIIKQKITQQQ